jgi:hypothetical protein
VRVESAARATALAILADETGRGEGRGKGLTIGGHEIEIAGHDLAERIELHHRATDEDRSRLARLLKDARCRASRSSAARNSGR